MNQSDLRGKAETAAKSHIIELIILRLEVLGRGERMTPGRKDDMNEMTKDELQRLYQSLNGDISGQQGIGLIVEAICESQNAKRAAEEERLARFGSAEISM